jgi:hypothetical protein
MLYREIIVICSQIHTKYINAVCGQNIELLNVKTVGTYSDHCVVHIVTIVRYIYLPLSFKGLIHIQIQYKIGSGNKLKVISENSWAVELYSQQ